MIVNVLQTRKAGSFRDLAVATVALFLGNERYRGGLVDFLNVLETQRTLLAVQDDLARSERTADQNLVRLYKALGGGWEGETELAEAKPKTR